MYYLQEVFGGKPFDILGYILVGDIEVMSLLEDEIDGIGDKFYIIRKTTVYHLNNKFIDYCDIPIICNIVKEAYK